MYCCAHAHARVADKLLGRNQNMKKRLTALFLCLVMMLSVFLASCADQSLEDAEEEKEKAKAANTLTLSMWIVSEKPVDPDIEKDVTKALNAMTEAKYKTRLDITYLSAEEYYAKLTDAIAAFQKTQAEEDAKKPDKTETTGKGEEEEGTTGVEFVTDENGMYRDSYPTLLKNQVDIIYIGDLEDKDGKLLMSGREMYTSLLNKGWLAALDESIKGSSKKLQEYVSPTLLSAVKDKGVTYAIPNNNVIGEYTYMCLNKKLMDRYSMQGFFTRNAIDGFFNEYVFQYLNMVSTNETGSLIPVDATYEECLALLAYYWNIDPADYSIDSDEFSIFGTLTAGTNPNRGENAVTVDSLFANEEFVENFLKLNKYRFDYPEFFRSEANADKVYDDCAIKFMKGDLSVLTIQNDSYYYYDEDGTCYYVVPVVYPTASDSDIYSDMFAVSSTTEDVDRAMEIITYINTNKEFRNILQYGVKDQHYTIENGTVTILKDKKGNSYEMDIYATGNAFLAYPTPTMHESIWENGKTQNRQSLVAPLLGFDLGGYAATMSQFGVTPEFEFDRDYTTTYRYGFTKELLSTDATLKEWIDACDASGEKGVFIFETKEKKSNDHISVLYVYNNKGEYDLSIEVEEAEKEGSSAFARNNTYVFTEKAEGTSKGLGYTLAIVNDFCPVKNEGSNFAKIGDKAEKITVKKLAKAYSFDVYNTDAYKLNVYGDLSVAHFYENKELYDQLMVWKGNTKLVDEETFVYTWVDSASSETKNTHHFIVYRNNVFQATDYDVVPLFNGTNLELEIRCTKYTDQMPPANKSYRIYYLTVETDKNTTVSYTSILNGAKDGSKITETKAETVHDFKVYGMLNTELIKYMDILNTEIKAVLDACTTYADMEATAKGLSVLLSSQFQPTSVSALGNCPALKSYVSSTDGIIAGDLTKLFYQVRHITNYETMNKVTGLGEDLADAKEARVYFYSPYGVYYQWMTKFSYLPVDMQK